MPGLPQSSAPLAEAIMAYARHNQLRFHTPGHAGGRGLSGHWGAKMAPAARLDVTELPDLALGRSTLDRVHEAEQLAAEAFGARHTRFLAAGSSLGLQALILSATHEGDDVVLPRNAHQSIIHALALSGARPVYVPVTCTNEGIPLGVTPAAFESALKRAVRPRLAVFLSPSYQGLCVDLPGLVRQAHDKGIPVIVDEAHGGHFRFSPYLPASACDSGADAWVQSAHKTLGALTGGAMLHVGAGAIDPESVGRALQVLAGTSPSYLILASIDETRRKMVLAGESLWRRAVKRAGLLRRGLAGLSGVAVVGENEVGCGGIIGYDPTRIVFAVEGYRGWEAGALLRRAGIEPEYADDRFVCLIVPFSIRERDVSRTLGSVARLAGRQGRTADCPSITVPLEMPETVLTPREALSAPCEDIPIGRAAGRVAAAVVAQCPPGVPVLVPGERISTRAVEYLAAEAGSDRSLVSVVLESR